MFKKVVHDFSFVACRGSTCETQQNCIRNDLGNTLLRWKMKAYLDAPLHQLAELAVLASTHKHMRKEFVYSL